MDFPAIFSLAIDRDGSIISYRSGEGGSHAWNLKLCCPLNDWEMAPISSLLMHIDWVGFGSEGEVDYHIWTGSKEGVFTVKSAYLSKLEDQPPFSLEKCIWKLRMPSKAALLLWLVTLNKVLTVDQPQVRDIQLANRCCFCKYHEEMAVNLFIHYPVSV